MNNRYFLTSLLLGASLLAVGQTSLYHATLSENLGVFGSTDNPEEKLYVHIPRSADAAQWSVAGNPGVLSSRPDDLMWRSTGGTCSWVSPTIFVAGYSGLSLSVELEEAQVFAGSDSVYVYVIEDGTQRLVDAQVANDFSQVSITESLSAVASVQVLILVNATNPLILHDVKVTGSYLFDDIDLDGIDDASDPCIDLDGDGTCDPDDGTLMLMDEDFLSYSVGTGIGGAPADEHGIAHVEGVSGAGASGWSLMGQEMGTWAKEGARIRASGSSQSLVYSKTGASSSDTTNLVALQSRYFDVSHVTDPRARFVMSEASDFTETNSLGKFSVTLVEDGVAREAFVIDGEFTSVDTTLVVNAINEFFFVVYTYAQREALLQLETMQVFGDYCQTGKNSEGECQDIGCTNPKACSYNSLAITNDESKCKYLGDACDDGDASNFSDRYVNAGDGTCDCEGYALQTLYLEDFSDYGAAQGGVNYGYEGSYDINPSVSANTNGAALETEWSLTFEDSNIGTGSSISFGPYYFATQVESSDTVMKAFNTNGDHMRWTSRTVNVAGFDRVHVSADLIGLGYQGSADYALVRWLDGGVAQTPVLEQLNGLSTATRAIFEEVSVTSGNLKVEVEIENNVAGSNTIASHGFDDVRVSGLKRGCSDPDASNYVAAPVDGFVALSDDGSCEYDWAKVYSRKDGEFDEVLWAGKPCSEAGYACGTSVMTIDIHSVTENGTRHAVVSANTKITVPTGGYSLGELTLESGAELVIPEGEVLSVNGDFHHEGGTISGTGRLLVKGEMEVASDVTSVEVHDFTFAQGAELALQDGDTLRIKGDLTIDDGSAISGRMELVGASAQTVTGSDVRFDTLRVASAGVTFASDAKVSGVLDIDLGVVEMDGHTLTFLSDADGSGMLDRIATGASLEDNQSGSMEAVQAVVKRHIAVNPDQTAFWGYAQYSSPLKGAKLGDLVSSADFTTSGFVGSDYPNSTSTITFWDEKKGLIFYPSQANMSMDTLGGGAWMAVLGSQAPTMHSEGTLRNHVTGGTVTMNLTRTPASNYEGWNLVYNPFQALLDWHEVVDYGSNASVIEDQFAVYNNASKGFDRYSKTNGAFTTAPRYIMPGQGFWVRMNHAVDTVATLTVPTSAISVNASASQFIRNEGDAWYDAELVLEIENSVGSDVAVVRLGDFGAEEYKRSFDLTLMESSNVHRAQLAVETGDKRCVAKALPLEASVPLYIRSRVGQETTLRVVGFTEEAEVCITITDTETGEVIVSRVGDEMTFVLPEQEAAPGRFVLDVRPSAQVFARPPSCPAMDDGRVEVSVGQEPTNVLLTDGGTQVLETFVGATGSAVFDGLAPGEYGLVVAGPDMKCGTERRSFVVEPGVEPELFGLDWTVPACNEGMATLDFEIYGHGDFHSSLRLGNEEVWAEVKPGGEVAIGELAPGTYALTVDHVCLQETVVLDLYDEEAVFAEADYTPMLVMDPLGGTALEAFSACIGEESYRWLVNGEVVGENEPLFHPVTASGGHLVQLEAWNETCADAMDLPFLVINWNEARQWEAPVTVREEGSHWALAFGADLGWTEMRMMDAAGRVVWTGQAQVENGYVHRLERPATAGTYLMQVIGADQQWGFPMLSSGF